MFNYLVIRGCLQTNNKPAISPNITIYLAFSQVFNISILEEFLAKAEFRLIMLLGVWSLNVVHK